MKLEEE